MLLAVAIMFTVMPMNAIAETAASSEGYTEVRTVQDLYNIRLDLTANYILMNDIDLTEATAKDGEWDFGGRGWNPIGSNDIYAGGAFSGIFDGNGFSITGMRIYANSLPSGASSCTYMGLFANVTGEIRDLHMKNVDISYGGYCTGAIAGSNSGIITRCSVSGKVDYGSASKYVGGLIGINSGEISYCYNTANVVGYYAAGGIAGYNSKSISNCYNTADIKTTCNDTSNEGTGGIVGRNAGDSSSTATITSCYNTGKISPGYSVYNRSGAIGYSYSNSSFKNCYYLTGTGNGSTGATVLTEAQMKLQSMYVGFDFENDWVLNTNAVYPHPQLRLNAQDIRELESAKIYTLPDNVIYTKGESLNVNGLVLEFKFTNADPEYVTVTNDMVEGYDSSKLGIQTLSVTYYKNTFTFDVTVKEKPFTEIRTVKELYDIRNDLTANYILMNDIDLTEATAKDGEWDFGGRGWNPIGSNDIYAGGAFSGIFDGNGFSITGMRIYANSLPSGASSCTYMGLFANVTGEIRDLHMKNVDISYGGYCTGAIAGSNSGIITRCSVSGKVDYGSASKYVGGLIGINSGEISYCYNTANVVGYYAAGGIAGYNSKSISNCYNTADIKTTCNDTSNEGTGGIVGRNAGDSSSTATITSCYNTGKISPGYSVYNRSGAIGYSYSNSSFKNCYYLTGTGNGSTGATVLTEAQMKLQSMYVGFDFENIWTLNSYANHPYPQLKSNVQDLNETVSLIRVIAYPAKTEYLTGDELNMVGGMFEAEYVSGKIDLLSITNDMISGYDPNKEGTQTLTVTYGGQSDTFEIKVSKRPQATSVTILTEPTQKQFVVGTKLDFTGATVKVEYDNNTQKVLDVTVEMTAGANINHMGTQTVTVTVDGHLDTFEIEVIPASISGISISSLPDKLTYTEGEKLDMTGLVIVANYTNGSRISIASGYTVTGYDANKIGEQTVTVDFIGKTATFTVTVVERVLTNIEIQVKPNKLDYVVGESLDLTGMVVVAAYETGELEIIDDYTVSGFDGKAGTKVIAVEYNGKSAFFTVNVAVITVEKLTITKMPVKLSYIENEALNTEGLIVTATYNNGTVKNVTDYEVTGFSSLPGTHTLYVTFGGKVASFQINVSAKVLSDVRVTVPNKTVYDIGEEFDKTGMRVVACYNNGQELTVDDYQINGFESSAAGTKIITVTYGGISRSFAVVVQERSVIKTGGNMIVGNLVGRLGDKVVIPVSVTKNTGIAGFTHTIKFDAKVLKLVSVDAIGRYADGTVILNDEKIADGEFTVLWFGSTDVNEDGIVYNLTFEVLESAPDGNSEIVIDFDDNDNGNISGENVVFGKMNGSVEVRSYWLGDLNGDREYHMVDLLLLAQYVSGKKITLTEKQLLAADVNEDNVIDIHDVIMLQQWIIAAGIPEA